MNPNPYAPPVDVEHGRWDHSLAKRIMYATAALLIVYLLPAAVGWWQIFRADPNHRHESVINTVVEFVSDWRDGNGLE